jgi:hypothetical protein
MRALIAPKRNGSRIPEGAQRNWHVDRVFAGQTPARWWWRSRSSTVKPSRRIPPEASDGQGQTNRTIGTG